MSNIYIQEPPTEGKVLVETSVGDIDIELWSKEAPKACRNFVQLCLEGYYNGTIFHRVIKGFIAQGGDPTGTGMGGESAYGDPFKDEFHSRLRFVRRGLVAMANAGKDDNGSQFFFTLGSCPELQNKHTIFGKVGGDTLYNMLRLEEGLITDSNDRPKFPNKIIKTKVIINPFPDITPRIAEKKETKQEKKEKKRTKNFKLLSFGDEAEEEDGEADSVAKDFRGKSKSSHDLANDPKLSSVPAIEQKEETEEIRVKDEEEEEKKRLVRLSAVQEKLKKSGQKHEKKDEKQKHEKSDKRELAESDDDEEDEVTLKKKAKVEEIKKEIRKIKRELAPKPEVVVTAEEVPKNANAAVLEYEDSLKDFEEKRKMHKEMKASNEERTLAMMNKFKEKLTSAQTNVQTKESEEGEKSDDDDDDDKAGWLSHKLIFYDDIKRAKDANIKDAETYEIFDPRNPINQRRRESSKLTMNKKK